VGEGRSDLDQGDFITQRVQCEQNCCGLWNRFINVGANVTLSRDSTRIPDTPLRLCHGTKVKRESSRSFTGFGNNRTFLNNGSLNDRQLVQHFGCGNVLGAKISELVFVTINMKEVNMASLTSLSDVVPSASNVARHAGNALIASSRNTGGTVGEHGDSRRALLVAVEEITINHDGLSARHDRNCHRVCFRFA